MFFQIERAARGHTKQTHEQLEKHVDLDLGLLDPPHCFRATRLE